MDQKKYYNIIYLYTIVAPPQKCLRYSSSFLDIVGIFERNKRNALAVYLDNLFLKVLNKV